MKALVIGGTGLIGSKVVERLRDQGHEVVVAAPSTGIDILTGEGLEAAMEGAGIVIDLSNSPSFEDEDVMRFFETAGQNILECEKKQGVKHHLALSVVGTEKLGESGYFRAKMAQERLIRASGIPYSIIHSTQFFEFVPGIVKSADDGGMVHLSPALVQPIASDDVADAVVRQALRSPAQGTVEIAGPERMPLDDLARRYLDAMGDDRQVVSDPHARYFGAELDRETLVPDGAAWKGEIGFERWLSQVTSAR